MRAALSYNPVAGLLIAVLLAGCSSSEYEEDPQAGLNGSFEVTRNGLPVNWYFYTPDTVSTGDFDIVLDTDNVRHGRQSLRFDVRESSAEGGKYSPGFFQEFDAVPGATYTVSFFVINDGTRFTSGVRGINPKTDGPFESIVEREASNRNWQRIEYKFTMPDHEALRFELSILSPGVLWIDDLSISD